MTNKSHDYILQMAALGNLDEMNLDDALKTRVTAAIDGIQSIRDEHDSTTAIINSTYLAPHAESSRLKLYSDLRARLDMTTKKLLSDLAEREHDLRLRLAQIGRAHV